jgi:hypothetical protein
MPLDEHGSEIDEDWEPDNPVLRGQTQVPDEMPLVFDKLDELPYRKRVSLGLHHDEPDPTYDPERDDLTVAL